VAAACFNDTTAPASTAPPAHRDQHAGDTVVSSTGLRYINNVTGTGNTARVCRSTRVHYVVRLTNGAVADSSDTAKPFEYTPLIDRVIPGFAEGVVGMRVGGRRRVIVPPQLGYGANAQASRGPGFAAIPANSTLIFDLTLVDAQK
jgi:peptidylprolyl isomerase